MDSRDARRLLTKNFDRLPTHRRAVIDEEIALSDQSERVRHL